MVALTLIDVLHIARTLGRSLKALRSGNLLPGNDPYDETSQSQRRDALHIAHHTFPSVLLPLTLGLLVACR